MVGLGQNSVDHVCLVETYPKVGSKTDALGYHLLPGGQVATAMLAVHRLGRRACYVGAVGDDDLGRRACSVLQAAGLDLRLKRVPGSATQFAMVTVDRSGERTIVEHYDPRTVVTAEDLDRRLFAETRVLHLDITDVPAAMAAAGWAREAGALVSMDIDRLLPGAEELLALVDLLVASEGVAGQLGSPNPRMALTTLRRHCNREALICITMGERGCAAALGGDDAIWVPAFQVAVRDTTGCGDVFRGALIHAVLDRQQLEPALRFATAAAALQAGSLGAQAGAPELSQVEQFLAHEPAVVEGRA